MARRFVVREVDGYTITLPVVEQMSGKRAPMLSVSVLDSAYCFEEVARFNQEEKAGWKHSDKRTQIRARAKAVADRLNKECA